MFAEIKKGCIFVPDNKTKTEIMKTLKLETALRQIKDGKFECLTDLKKGYIEIRKANNKRETIEVI